MVCPKCGNEQPEGREDCLRCGVIFSRIHPTGEGVAVQDTIPRSAVSGNERSRPPGFLPWLRERLFSVGPEENGLLVAGRAVVFLVLLVWGFRLMTSTIASNYVGESFLHLVNLPFHEAGHVIFSPFGYLMLKFGGTLGQWLVPFIVLCAFVARGNPFGGVVGLWWLGESFLDIAPYMDDARAGQLVLIGGVTGSEYEDVHDWECILSRLGWLQHDHLIARISFGIGVALMLLAFAWGGYILWRQFQAARQGI
jgi:hypothetical protein